MRLLNASLLAILLILQYPLWFAENSWHTVLSLRKELTLQQAENQRLADRNKLLLADVQDLRSGTAAVEERARMELGMVREGEVFVQYIK